jgi:carboxypeptidase Taq
MGENYLALKKRMADIGNIHRASAVLGWDMRTYMPSGGANGRADQLALLSKLAHQMFIDDLTGNLLEKAEAEMAGAEDESEEACLLRNLRRDFDRDVKIPSDMAEEMSHHTALAEDAWVQARATNNFQQFAPYLEKTLELVKKMAAFLGFEDDPYRPLVDIYEPGITPEEIDTIFEGFKTPLTELLKAIQNSSPRIDNSPIEGDYPTELQNRLTLWVVEKMGYDLRRGRQDPTVHPFCISFSRDDVRITTRFAPNRIEPALFGSMHETGHALYEQGLPTEYDNTAIGGAASLGIHESQSRFWENIIGRSMPFCEYIMPELKEIFPAQFGGIDAARFFSSINRVSPSFIRVEADEVTYNLHILLRFELERELLGGALSVQELPDAWNEKMREYLGITPQDYASGVLQDIHWAGGMIGYFPTYTLGNLNSAQLWNAIQKDIPDTSSLIRKGEFAPILNWQREKIHRHGSKYFPAELIRRATGEPLDWKYFMDYLQKKYALIYNISN